MRVLVVLLLPLLVVGCTKSDDDSGDQSAAPTTARQSPAPTKPEKLVHLEAAFEEGALTGEASYKVKRLEGKLMKEFEVELENGTPGDVYSIAIDGVLLGMLILDLDGEGEITLGDDGEPFPDDFPEPQAGSVVRIGDSIQLSLRSVLEDA